MRRLTAALAMSPVIAPIILIILTIWVALALASPVSAASPDMQLHLAIAITDIEKVTSSLTRCVQDHPITAPMLSSELRL